MFTCTEFRCELCGEEVGRLDEQNRCEQCVLRAERLATEPLARLEELVQAALETGLTEQQLREAFELSLAGEEGELPELALSRQHREDERVEWVVAPYSAWLDYVPDYEPNRIRRLRRMRALSAETVADRLGVAVAELALWEHTPEVPADIVHRLAEMFGVSVPHLMKTDMDWLQG
jgi:ribosome-binding protein aMBF1 (putative translation factor)